MSQDEIRTLPEADEKQRPVDIEFWRMKLPYPQDARKFTICMNGEQLKAMLDEIEDLRPYLEPFAVARIVARMRHIDSREELCAALAAEIDRARCNRLRGDLPWRWIAIEGDARVGAACGKDRWLRRFFGLAA